MLFSVDTDFNMELLGTEPVVESNCDMPALRYIPTAYIVARE